MDREQRCFGLGGDGRAHDCVQSQKPNPANSPALDQIPAASRFAACRRASVPRSNIPGAGGGGKYASRRTHGAGIRWLGVGICARYYRVSPVRRARAGPLREARLPPCHAGGVGGVRRKSEDRAGTNPEKACPSDHQVQGEQRTQDSELASASSRVTITDPGQGWIVPAGTTVFPFLPHQT